jgi:hypothetical protein
MGKVKRKWQEQLEAAERSGLSLARYAAKHGLNVRNLYDTRHAGAKAKAARARKASAFVRIRLKPLAPVIVASEGHRPRTVATLAMQARLANGVILSWTHDGSAGPALADLMHTLAGLPCSA